MSLSRAHTKPQPNVSTVENWLTTLGMSDYESLFIAKGFDHLDFLVRLVTTVSRPRIDRISFFPARRPRGARPQGHGHYERGRTPVDPRSV